MRFKLFGTEFYVSFLFSAMITLMLAVDKTGYILPVLFAVTMHELGHLTVMRILDCSPLKVRLIPAAIEITARFNCSRKKEISVALAGPAFNLLLFLSLFANYGLSGNEYSLVWALVNLSVCVYNMLPVTGLDGGTVLYSLISARKTPAAAALAMRIIGLSLSAAALFAGALLLLRGRFNPSFFIAALYFAVLSIAKR